MDRYDIIKLASDFVQNSEENYIKSETAISENVVRMKMFEAPIFAFGSADDEYFTLFKEPNAIGSHFMIPKEWLPQAKTVISFFLPFTDSVKSKNRKDKLWPSDDWLHGCLEGEFFIKKLCKLLEQKIIDEGINTLVPIYDERFWNRSGSNKSKSDEEVLFTSNWSERHAAFVCGLGTFGLSKGIITSKGMAGILGSLITELYLEPDKREYTDIYEYCIKCGACIRRCPANSITMENGKNHQSCCDFLDIIEEKTAPRYGCGKCQTGVPCESTIP